MGCFVGEPWINDAVYSKFAQDHLKDDNFNLKYFPSTDTYKIKSKFTSFANDTYTVNITGSRLVSYKKIIEFALYHNIPDYKKTIFRNGKDIKIADQKLITAVQLKVDKLNEAFTKWLTENKHIAHKLEQIYNYSFNAFIKEKTDATQFDFGIKNITP